MFRFGLLKKDIMVLEHVYLMILKDFYNLYNSIILYSYSLSPTGYKVRCKSSCNYQGMFLAQSRESFTLDYQSCGLVCYIILSLMTMKKE